MAVQTVTVHLPDTLYHQVKQRADQMHRSVEDELVAVVAEALPTLDDLPTDIAEAMTQLIFLTDKELWQAASATVAASEHKRMQALLLKRQREGLTPHEEQELCYCERKPSPC
jgi:plasmid stability protein